MSAPIISSLGPTFFAPPTGAFLLHLTREIALADRTIGKLFVDGEWQWWTLEDQLRPPSAPKVAGATAIPAGSYRVKKTWSNRFGKLMWQICDVPGFAGVRIHVGNTPADTEGCVLVGGGYDRRSGNLLHSKIAYDKVDAALGQVAAAQPSREIWITIVNPPESYH